MIRAILHNLAASADRVDRAPPPVTLESASAARISGVPLARSQSLDSPLSTLYVGPRMNPSSHRSPSRTDKGLSVAYALGYSRGRFIIRNGWGTSWGEGGFAYATEQYATAAFKEAYGVVV